MVVAFGSDLTVNPLGFVWHVRGKGTTIGYGDETPKSDLGKVLVALYAILVVNVMAVLLQPSKDFLERLCRPQALPMASAKADKKD